MFFCNSQKIKAKNTFAKVIYSVLVVEMCRQNIKKLRQKKFIVRENLSVLGHKEYTVQYTWQSYCFKFGYFYLFNVFVHLVSILPKGIKVPT